MVVSASTKANPLRALWLQGRFDLMLELGAAVTIQRLNKHRLFPIENYLFAFLKDVAGT